MSQKFRKWPLALILLSVACSHKEASAPEPASNPAFNAFIDDHFKLYFAMYPTNGTAAGLHEYDRQIENFEASRIQARINEIKGLLSKLDGLRGQKLSESNTIDAQLIDSQLRSELQDLEVIQSWKTNPMVYVGLPGAAVDGLMKRNFAPAPERLGSITVRLKGVDPLLRNMRANVQNPPKEFTDLAMRMAKGSVGFFKSTLPDWAKGIEGVDESTRQQFAAANATAVKAFEDAARWLEHDLMPKSKGAYAIGATNYADKLKYDEMVEIPLPKLLEIGERNLEKDYRDFIETAKKIDPKKTPAQVMASLSNDHPTEDKLLDFAKQTLEGARQFLRDKKIIDLPSEIRPQVLETPPYARSGTFASMDTPGAYERKATEAFYYVTPPEADWTPKHKEEHLRLYNRPVLDVITIHEVYPGHYTQFLYAPRYPTKARKLI
ncbi:MAG TPA: DUF885 family protein, partial [Bryobacteraceae bacterium]|nr:DUF885 family protein [Bryobacteraceae bacterium]